MINGLTVTVLPHMYSASIFQKPPFCYHHVKSDDAIFTLNLIDSTSHPRAGSTNTLLFFLSQVQDHHCSGGPLEDSLPLCSVLLCCIYHAMLRDFTTVERILPLLKKLFLPVVAHGAIPCIVKGGVVALLAFYFFQLE